MAAIRYDRSTTGALAPGALYIDTRVVQWVGGFNYPYAGLKTGGNEGGVRGPGFVVSERFIGKGGTKFEGLFHIADWYPTLLSIVDKARKHENDHQILTGFDGIDQ